MIWRSTVPRLRFKPEEGLEVIATGRITTFPGKSKYQIVIEALEPAGIGALMALLEERKQKLAAEGLFEEARKKPLPYPAARGRRRHLADRRRDPRHAAPARRPLSRARAGLAGARAGRHLRRRGGGRDPRLQRAAPGGAHPRPDVLIVARGGGPLEDLWGFNEETVVRAAAASAIPLISAVGHETDWTLIDHAADMRAPTPTGAAEMVVPVRAELAAAVQRSRPPPRGGGPAGAGAAALGPALRRPSAAHPGGAVLGRKRQRLDLAPARLGPR